MTDGVVHALPELDRIRVISFAQNRGSGTARQAGTALAGAEMVVWTDADMTYPNHRIPAKWLIRLLASFLVRTRIPDLNSGVRAFRRVVAGQYLQILPAGFSCVTTLTMSFPENGHSVRYTPIDYQPRAGMPKFHWWKDTIFYIREVVRMVLLWNPLRLFAPIGVVLGAARAGKLVYDLGTEDLRFATNTVVLLIAAALVILVALVADLLVQLNRSRNAVLPAHSSSDDPSGG